MMVLEQVIHLLKLLVGGNADRSCKTFSSRIEAASRSGKFATKLLHGCPSTRTERLRSGEIELYQFFVDLD